MPVGAKRMVIKVSAVSLWSLQRFCGWLCLERASPWVASSSPLCSPSWASSGCLLRGERRVRKYLKMMDQEEGRIAQKTLKKSGNGYFEARA